MSAFRGVTLGTWVVSSLALGAQVTVVARKSAVVWDEDLARHILDQIVADIR